MKKFYVSISVAAVLLAVGALPILSATRSLPIVEILGTEYYLYEARKGETLFGIAREQNWDDTELKRLNPQVVAPLKKGTKLFYPVNVSKTKGLPPVKVQSDPVVELTHVVGKGESVYSIAGMYDMPVETIYRLNPYAKDGIKAGDVIALRDTRKAQTETDKKKNPAFHTVGKSESIKNIADRYNTSVASIMAINPGVASDKLPEGEVVKLPADGTGLVEVTKVTEIPKLDTFELYTVKGHETWESIAERRGLDTDLLVKANPDVSKLKNNQVISVPNVVKVKEEHKETDRDARESTPEGIKSIYEDVHKVSDATKGLVSVRVAIVAENPSAKKDAEFIRGFLAGVDEIKKRNFKVALKVIDGSESSSPEKIIETLGDFDPNLVFFTGDRNMPSYLRDYASTSLTPVVNTFDIKSEDYLHNPYIIQLLTPSAYFNESVAGNAYTRFGDRTLIIIGEEDSSDQLAPELKKRWNPALVKTLPEGIVDKDIFTDNGKYVFYAYTVKKNEIEKILKDVAEIRENLPLADIAVLGRPNWVMFDDSLSEEMHKVNTYIPSRFYIDPSSDKTTAFNNSYKNLFNRQPAKSVPLYAAVGYDASTYFITAMADSSNDVNLIKPSKGTVQSEFNLKRVSNWGGFINPPVYFVNFTSFDTIDKIVID